MVVKKAAMQRRNVTLGSTDHAIDANARPSSSMSAGERSTAMLVGRNQTAIKTTTSP